LVVVLSDIYSAAVVFQVSVWMDDGDDPIAGGGWSEDFLDLDDARGWAKEKLKEQDPNEGLWYAEIESGHYENTGTTGFLEVDCEWVGENQEERILL
jgi:hypothetical protein